MKNAIAVCQDKGGTAKSHTTINLVAVLAEKGFKTLVIDLDPGATATLLLTKREPDEYSLTIKDVLFEGVDPYDVVSKTAIPNVDIIPCSKAFSGANTRLVSEDKQSELEDEMIVYPEERLSYEIFATSDITNNYDYVFIDCPARIDKITLNAMYFADKVIVPVMPSDLSLRGMLITLSSIRAVNKRHTRNGVSLDGVVIARHSRGANIYKSCIDAVPGLVGEKNIYNQVIRKAAAIEESERLLQPVVISVPKSNVADDYRRLTDEFLERNGGEG